MADNIGDHAPAFSDMYGKVVFAKVGTYPWWPALVCDPSDKSLDMKKPIRDKGKKVVGKTYVIYNYGDGNYGFCDKKQLQLFSAESLEKVRTANKTKLKGAYVESFERGVTEATQDCAVPQNRRAAVMRKYIIENPPPAAVASSAPSVSTESASLCHVGEDGVVVYAEEVEGSSKSNKRRRNTKEGVETENDRVKRYTTGDATKPTKRDGAAEAEAEARRSAFAQESRTDRLARLKATLIQTTTIPSHHQQQAISSSSSSAAAAVAAAGGTAGETSGTFDETRALKIIRKLGEMHLTLDEIKTCALGKLIAELRSHVSEAISTECKKLRKRWIEERAPIEATRTGAGAGNGDTTNNVDTTHQRESGAQPSTGERNDVKVASRAQEQTPRVVPPPPPQRQQQQQQQERHQKHLSPDRKVAVVMLQSCVSSLDIAFALEEILHELAVVEMTTAIGEENVISSSVIASSDDSFVGQRSVYYESITRIFAMLSQPQNSGMSKVKDRLSILLTQYIANNAVVCRNSNSPSSSAASSATAVVEFLRKTFCFLRFPPVNVDPASKP